MRVLAVMRREWEAWRVALLAAPLVGLAGLATPLLMTSAKQWQPSDWWALGAWLGIGVGLVLAGCFGATSLAGPLRSRKLSFDLCRPIGLGTLLGGKALALGGFLVLSFLGVMVPLSVRHPGLWTQGWVEAPGALLALLGAGLVVALIAQVLAVALSDRRAWLALELAGLVAFVAGMVQVFHRLTQQVMPRPVDPKWLVELPFLFAGLVLLLAVGLSLVRGRTLLSEVHRLQALVLGPGIGAAGLLALGLVAWAYRPVSPWDMDSWRGYRAQAGRWAVVQGTYRGRESGEQGVDTATSVFGRARVVHQSPVLSTLLDTETGAWFQEEGWWRPAGDRGFLQAATQGDEAVLEVLDPNAGKLQRKAFVLGLKAAYCMLLGVSPKGEQALVQTWPLQEAGATGHLAVVRLSDGKVLGKQDVNHLASGSFAGEGVVLVLKDKGQGRDREVVRWDLNLGREQVVGDLVGGGERLASSPQGDVLWRRKREDGDHLVAFEGGRLVDLGVGPSLSACYLVDRQVLCLPVARGKLEAWVADPARGTHRTLNLPFQGAVYAVDEVAPGQVRLEVRGKEPGLWLLDVASGQVRPLDVKLEALDTWHRPGQATLWTDGKDYFVWDTLGAAPRRIPRGSRLPG